MSAWASSTPSNVISNTASTIGFGEIPYPFTYNQRMWVTISIYLTVVGWASAIGSLLALLQESGFRQALALQHFTRKVERMREPFLLIVGYGRTGELLARSLDALGRRFVVIDGTTGASTTSTSTPTTRTCPAWSQTLATPGTSPSRAWTSLPCEGVLALTDDDEANLAVVQAAALLRPDLPVITRAVSPDHGRAVRAFGTPTVVNPFDRFGAHLRIALPAPASYQLMTWLESGPGAPLPPRGLPAVARALGDLRVRPLRAGGHFRLRGGGLDVNRGGAPRRRPSTTRTPSSATATSRGCWPAPGSNDAAGFVAGTDNDTTNLSLIAAARRANPDAVRRGPAEQGGQCAAVRSCRGGLDARPRGRRRT